MSASFRKEFADRLKSARLSAGITQAELADNLCVSRHSVCMYETARRLPTLETFVVIADVLDVPPEWLLPPSQTVGDRTFIDGQTNIYDMLEEE